MTSAVVTDTGIYHSDGSGRDLSLADAWHRLDTSAGHGAHGVVLAVAGPKGAVAWSGPDGLRIVRLTRGSLAQPGLTLPGPVHHQAVAGPASRGAPLAALLTDSALDVLWSPDRHDVHWLNERPGLPFGLSEPRPELELRGERLGSMDVALESSRTAWLAATTERGALLLTRWDLVYDVFDPWIRPRCPLPAVRHAAVANVCGIPTVFVTAAEGAVLAADTRDAAANRADWNPVPLPSGVRGPTAGVLAASDCDGRAWLAEATDTRMWSAPLTSTDRLITCGVVTESVIA